MTQTSNKKKGLILLIASDESISAYQLQNATDKLHVGNKELLNTNSEKIIYLNIDYFSTNILQQKNKVFFCFLQCEKNLKLS